MMARALPQHVTALHTTAPVLEGVPRGSVCECRCLMHTCVGVSLPDACVCVGVGACRCLIALPRAAEHQQRTCSSFEGAASVKRVCCCCCWPAGSCRSATLMANSVAAQPSAPSLPPLLLSPASPPLLRLRLRLQPRPCLSVRVGRVLAVMRAPGRFSTPRGRVAAGLRSQNSWRPLSTQKRRRHLSSLQPARAVCTGLWEAQVRYGVQALSELCSCEQHDASHVAGSA
jgi:hypothetical protein